MRLKTLDKIRHPSTIPTINITPMKNPDRIIPPGTVANFKSKLVRSPADKSPNMIFTLRSVISIASNGPG